MGRYDRQIATARRLIRKYGQPCLWADPGTPVPDPERPGMTIPAQPVVYTDIPIAFFPPSVLEIGQISNINASLNYARDSDVVTFSLIGYMPKVAFTPNLNGVVTRDGKELFLLNIQTLAPNGDDILYMLVFK